MRKTNLKRGKMKKKKLTKRIMRKKRNELKWKGNKGEEVRSVLL